MENMVTGLINFYKGKKVLITGHTGFKGSWLSIWLLSLGARVIGVSLPPEKSKCNFKLTNLESRLENYYQDIRNFIALNKIFDQTQPDVVFHLAAQALVLDSYRNPQLTFETNTQGTVNILEASRLTHSVKQIILVTTDKVYKNKDWVWGYREIDQLGGYDPYSASKAAAEIIIDSYIKSFFNPEKYEEHGKVAVSVRAGNVIGGGDWADNRIIPDFFKSIEESKPLKIRNPNATRPWQHVLEPLAGYLILGTKMDSDPVLYSGAWNFGPQHENNLTVLQLITKLINYTQKGESKVKSGESALHEANLLKLDVSKAEKLLNFHNYLNLDETIRLTADWYNNYNKEDVYRICLNQIEYWSKKYNEKHA